METRRGERERERSERGEVRRGARLLVKFSGVCIEVTRMRKSARGKGRRGKGAHSFSSRQRKSAVCTVVSSCTP